MSQTWGLKRDGYETGTLQAMVALQRHKNLVNTFQGNVLTRSIKDMLDSAAIECNLDGAVVEAARTETMTLMESLNSI